MDQRCRVIDQLAEAIAGLDLGHPTRVAIDGRTASDAVIDKSDPRVPDLRLR